VSEGERAQLQRLIARLAEGDRSAIEPTFVLLWPIVKHFALRALPVPADAEDAAQQAILKVFAQAADYDRARDAVAWALTIAAFEVRTIRRKVQRRREVASDVSEIAAAGVDPERLLLERDLEAAARDAVATLGHEDAALILAAVDEERRARAGQGKSATLRKRLERALARLRVVWRAKHDTE
jgi:DNA-directed RNA polymerase specialized sigma24 family protein